MLFNNSSVHRKTIRLFFSKILFKILLASGIVTFFPFQLYAQHYHAENISLAQGLSQSTVYCLSQDTMGFLWIGTQDGLNKFDGLQFKTYYNQPFDSLSLTSGNIKSFLSDSKGRLWVGTANSGLNLFLPKNEKFRNNFSTGDKTRSISDNSINTIAEDCSGNIWVGTAKGLNKVLVSEGAPENAKISFSQILFDSTGSESNMIWSIFSEDTVHLWVGTKNGLFRLTFDNRKADIPKTISVFGKKNGLPANEIRAITADVFGNLWIATSSELVLYDHEKKLFSSFLLSRENKKSMANTAYALCSSTAGNLWIGSGDGLFLISKNELSKIPGELPEIIPVLPKEKSMTGLILSLHEDKINKGILWIGSEASGMTKLSPISKNFVTNHLNKVLSIAFVFSILKDDNGILWLGTTNGLIRFDMEHDKYSLFKSSEDDNSLHSDYVNSIKKDATGNIWAGTFTGVYRIIDPYSSHPRFARKPVNPDIPAAPVRHMYIHQNGELYVVLPRKVYQYNPRKDFFEEVISIQDKQVEGLNSFINTSFVVDAKGNYWLGSTNGLFIFSKNASGKYDFDHPEKFFHHPKDTTSLRCHAINDMTEDSDGAIWIATANGLTKAVRENNRVHFTNYSTDDGLKNNAVYTVLENPDDRTLWMSTNGGLSKFDQRKNIFSNYDLHDGLQSNEFNGGACFRSADNEFFFGGVNGYSSFYPKEIISDTVMPKVSITDFRLPGSDPGFSSANKKINLSYNQNSFSIDFIALHYVNPSRNQYAYILEGYQKEWTYSGTSHQVNFYQLPPGHYIFKVKGSNNDGIYNEAGDSIDIVIHPPFWKTPWFYFIVAGFILLGFWLIHLYRLKMKMLQVREIERIRKETAADFHDELGHKLTTISWFGEILKKKMDPRQVELRSYLDKIIETSGSLYHTMKDLVWAMDPGKDSLDDLYIQLKLFGESLFDQTGVEFRAVEVNGELKDVEIPLTHKRHVLLIFKEAMHNSFKHSKGTSIVLDLTRENNHFTLKLRDNGTGFVFDWNQTGNGLKNVRKRADLIKGKLDIYTSDKGTSIILEVPLKN